MKRIFALTLFTLAITASAQQPKPSTPVCSNQPEPSGFTGCEITWLNHYREQMSPLQQKVNDIQQEARNYITLVIAQHADMQYLPSTPDQAQQFPYGRLVSTKPPEKAKPVTTPVAAQTKK